MTRIRILLVALPALLRDILAETLAREPDMEIVGTVTTRAELDELARPLYANVVIITANGDDAWTLAARLTHDEPHAALLAISVHGDRATLYVANRQPLALDDVSPSAIVQAIRDHCAANGSTRLPPA